MSLLSQKFKFLRQKETTTSGHQQIEKGGREWESMYRNRWSYDKVVRSTHGVNCTGSCSWNVYVKNGIVTWEHQATDYPETPDNMPDYEPRGCPRGAAFSWYMYSPLRVKYPYMRAELAELWREARKTAPNALEAWKTIAEDPEKGKKYKSVRGMGGFVRSTWDEVSELIAASMLYTTKTYGPDRNAGFSVIPAMSMLSYAAGTRFLNLMGGVCLSFYDWYADLPPASPQVWGDQTDSPESGDWFNAGYIITWGSNVPLTRTPDAHFLTEVRYKGTKVISVSPDYAESTTAADAWLNVKAGTDSALAMAMGHVILNEYYWGEECKFFTDYAKKYTDMPFLILLDEQADGSLQPGRFLNSKDLGRTGKHADFKQVLIDETTKELVIPNGTMGDHYDNEEKWNLRQENSETGAPIMPLLTILNDRDDVKLIRLPYFGDKEHQGFIERAIPVKKVETTEGTRYITTVHDLIMANYGINRGLGGEAAESYEADTPYTPAWQEKITGIKADIAINIAREFADNSIKTKGRSMIIMGGGINHWYHADIIYRTILNLVMFTATEGVNGGGWAHYVGQEKLRPSEGWGAVMTAGDWSKPPRLQNGTSFFYFHTDQWRSDVIDTQDQVSPLKTPRYHHPADYNVMAARLGWLPAYPTFNKGSQQIFDAARAEGAKDVDDVKNYVAQSLKNKDLEFCYEDPDAPENFPRNLFVWRANLIGSSSKGHEYFLKHFLGTKNGVLEDDDCPARPEEVKWHEKSATGKLDLLIDIDFRMASTGLYSDIVLPAATWYEKEDLSSTDMHPYIHVFQAATDCAWETKSDWDTFRTIAEAVSKLAKEVGMTNYEDLVAMPLQHDSEGETAQPEGRILDWSRGECEPIPGKTMPNLVPVQRDYSKIFEKFIALGPNVSKTMGNRNVSWDCSQEYEELKVKNGMIENKDYISYGMPSLYDVRGACNATLTLSSCSNGRIAVESWKSLEQHTGLSGLSDISKNREADRITFENMISQPQFIISSVSSTGKNDRNRRYSPFTTSTEDLVPFRTVTGRQSYYLDHELIQEWGEAMATYKPVLSYKPVQKDYSIEGIKEITLKYLTPHNKWSIHSMYFDNQQMLTLFRGGQTIWLNEDDAADIDVKDNDWVECFNKNGVVAARAVVTPRIPRGITYVHHSQDRHINVPGAQVNKERGGTHNAPTHIHVKPTHMIGGYGQLSYGFNYYGPTGNQRDMTVVARKMKEVDWLED